MCVMCGMCVCTCLRSVPCVTCGGQSGTLGVLLHLSSSACSHLSWSLLLILELSRLFFFFTPMSSRDALVSAPLWDLGYRYVWLHPVVYVGLEQEVLLLAEPKTCL